MDEVKTMITEGFFYTDPVSTDDETTLYIALDNNRWVWLHIEEHFAEVLVDKDYTWNCSLEASREECCYDFQNDSLMLHIDYIY